jgi:hypothetical protein
MLRSWIIKEVMYLQLTELIDLYVEVNPNLKEWKI